MVLEADYLEPLSNLMWKALQYAFRDRRNKKRTFRSLWISRISAALMPLRSFLQQIYQSTLQGQYKTR